MPLVIDTATPIPGAVLAAAGVTCVVRYLSSIKGPKIITQAEYNDLRAHGIQVLLVYEDTINDMSAGLDGGILHGKTAVYEAATVGYPLGSAIYFACDSNQVEPGTRDTMSAAAFVTSHYGYKVGWYGRADTGRLFLATGQVQFVWAVDSWPGGMNTAGISLFQRANHAPLTEGGVRVDVDEIPTGASLDFGQAA